MTIVSRVPPRVHDNRPTAAPTASDLAGRFGWSVIPIAPGTKRPLIRWAQFQRTGTTPAMVEAWAEEFPECNWALLLGRPSGVLALDVDSAAALHWVEVQGGFRPNGETPPWYDTGRGWQFIFRLPADLLDVRGVDPHPGVEIRVNGMYSVVPPSIHPSGKPYTWRKPPTSLDEIPFSPEWIIRALRGEAGEMLAATERSVGTKGQFKGKDSSGGAVTLPPEETAPTLADLGVTKRESSEIPSTSGTPIRAINAKLQESSVYTWLMRSRFLKGSRRMAFYNLALIQKGIGFTEGESWASLKAWREHRCSPAYGFGDDDPGEPQRIFSTVWRHAYRPTLHHLREPINSRGQRVTVASGQMLCRYYPNTKPRSTWLHEPAVVGLFRCLEALARHRIGLDRPEALTHRQLGALAGVSQWRVMHAAPLLDRLGIRELRRKGRSEISTYSLSNLTDQSTHTVCMGFVRSGMVRGPAVLLWRRLVRCFSGVIRRLSEALRSLKCRALASPLAEIGSSGLRPLSGVAWSCSGRGPPRNGD